MAWLAQSHYLNQCWNIVNWTLTNELQWNCNRNSYIFIQENAFENYVVWKMAAILSHLNVLKIGHPWIQFTGAWASSRLPWLEEWWQEWRALLQIDGWVQERCNSSALAMELYIFLAQTHWDGIHVSSNQRILDASYTTEQVEKLLLFYSYQFFLPSCGRNPYLIRKRNS